MHVVVAGFVFVALVLGWCTGMRLAICRLRRERDQWRRLAREYQAESQWRGFLLRGRAALDPELDWRDDDDTANDTVPNWNEDYGR